LTTPPASSAPGNSAAGSTVATIEDLHASASRQTGLADYGAGDGDAYADGLAVLLDSLNGEAALTPAGSKALRAFLRGALTARLLSQAAWRAHPEYARVPIERPVFIIGLPRTGTTALHRLLTADPGSQGLEMTHRAPRTAIASACSLTAHASAGWSPVFTGNVIGRTQLDLWVRGLSLFTEARARHDPARFHDVSYEDLVTDPVGTVEAIYARFGLPLSGAAADAMRSLAAASLAGGESPHRYSLEEYGLTGGDVDERFAASPPDPSFCFYRTYPSTAATGRNHGPSRGQDRADHRGRARHGQVPRAALRR
jgi:hypothetical protein